MDVWWAVTLIVDAVSAPWRLCGALGVLAVGWLLVRYRRPRGCPPGPPVLPVVGSSPFLPDTGDWAETFERLRLKHGDIFSFALGKSLFVVVMSHAAAREALEDQAVECAGRPRRHRVLKYYARQPGMLGLRDHCYSEEWSRQKANAIRLLCDGAAGPHSVQNAIRLELKVLKIGRAHV